MCVRSKFPEVTKLESLRSGAVVKEKKRQYGIQVISAEVALDNGPHFTSGEFQEFTKECGS